MNILVSCEHAVATVPTSLRDCFSNPLAQSQLKSHLGHDIGAARWAWAISLELGTHPILGSCSRLVVDLNRSSHHPRVLSNYTRGLPSSCIQDLLRRFHNPHWSKVQDAIEGSTGPCVHIAIHSFTPELGGQKRNADVGILYDSRRCKEKHFATVWQSHLRRLFPKLLVRRNYPYVGKSDGLPTGMRKKFSQETYLGFEIEINQLWDAAPIRKQLDLIKAISKSLVETEASVMQ